MENIDRCPVTGKEVPEGVCQWPDAVEMLKWEYTCHQCRSTFALPVPDGPARENEIKCPRCGSHDMERINVQQYEACPPGG